MTYLSEGTFQLSGIPAAGLSNPCRCMLDNVLLVLSPLAKVTVASPVNTNGVGCGEGLGDVEVEYVVDPLSFDDFAFEHSVPPVNMHAVHMKHVCRHCCCCNKLSAGSRITTCQNAAGGSCRIVIWALQRLAFTAKTMNYLG